MGKKRKVKEISEEDRIQTILVQDPYGYRQADTWDAVDQKRRDEGLYVVVEWLEFIFGGQGRPGSLQTQRTRGPAVEDVWAWSGRMELLISIRRDIDLTPQFGKHNYSVFLRRPPRGPDDTRSAIIKPARYQTSDQIEGKGEGWKLVSPLPSVEVPLIRKHKFVDPYPSPGLPTVSQHTKLATVKSEDSKDTKSHVKHEEVDSKPAMIKQDIEVEVAMSTGSATDVKPTLAEPPVLSSPMVKLERSSAPLKQGPKEYFDPGTDQILEVPLDISPVKVEDTGVKEEDFNDMIRRAQARREEARRVALASGGSSSAYTSQQRNPILDLGGIYDFSGDTSQVTDSGKHSVDLDPRPTKRVKKEEPSWR